MIPRLLLSLLLLLSSPLWAAQPLPCAGHGMSGGHGGSAGTHDGVSVAHVGDTERSASVPAGHGHADHAGTAHAPAGEMAGHADHQHVVSVEPGVAGQLSMSGDSWCTDCDLGCMAACAVIALPLACSTLPVLSLAAVPLPGFSSLPLHAHRVPLLRPPSLHRHG